jgi:hypothetical protein
MEVFDELVADFEVISGAIRTQLATLQPNKAFIKDRLSRCKQLIASYRVELRFALQTKNKTLTDKLALMDNKYTQLSTDVELKTTDVELKTTDDMLKKANEIQKRDTSIQWKHC